MVIRNFYTLLILFYTSCPYYELKTPKNYDFFNKLFKFKTFIQIHKNKTISKLLFNFIILCIHFIFKHYDLNM